MSPTHHPLILQVPRSPHVVPGGSVTDQVTRSHYRHTFVSGFADAYVPPTEPYTIEPSLPAFDDEYFDWVALVESVHEARDRFVFMELGAGYGRWLVRALKLASDWRHIPAFAIAAEAEPEHFAFIQQHMRDNGIDPAAHYLANVAVDGKPGTVQFAVGSASGWYGQSIARHDPEVQTREMPAVTIEMLIEQAGVDRIDLLHMDVQRAEAVIIPASREALKRHVHRICVGIHGKAGEKVRATLAADGWHSEVDYPRKTTCDTPYGAITFGDGVQVWTNPNVS